MGVITVLFLKKGFQFMQLLFGCGIEFGCEPSSVKNPETTSKVTITFVSDQVSANDSTTASFPYDAIKL